MSIELIEAILNNSATDVKRLLENGADPNFCLDKAKITPLHFAAQNNVLRIVPLLIEAGANLNAKTFPEGETPLKIAQVHGHIEMVNLLAVYLSQQYLKTEH